MPEFKHLPRNNVFFGPLRRTLALLVVGVAILGLSCLAEFKSLNWIYDSDSGKIHMLTCPQLGLNMKRSDFINQGNFCEVKIYGWDVEARSRLFDSGFVQPEFSCSVPRFDMVGDNWDEFSDFRLKNPLVCKVKNKCSAVRACTVQVGGVDRQVACPRGPEEALSIGNQASSLLWVVLRADTTLLIRWVNYENTIFTEFCDEKMTVPVAKMVAVRGMVASLALLVLAWLFTDILLHLAYRRYRKNTVKLDMAAVEEEFNVNLFIHLWTRFTPPANMSRTVSMSTPRAMTPSNAREGMIPRLISAQTPRSMTAGSAAVTPRSFKVAICQDPQLAFSGAGWRAKITAFLERKLRPRGVRKESFFRILFVPLGVILMGSLFAWAYLAISPRNLYNMHSVMDAIADNYSSIWRASATWTILPFLLLDELADVAAFLCMSAVTRFARPTVIAKFHEEVGKDDESVSEVSFSSDSLKVVQDELIPESVIGVFCVDTRHLADEEKLVQNVKSLIAIVGIEQLFVLHFSDSLSPPDDTVTLLQRRVHPAIQYVYVPERDKVAALYWFSKYYVPLFQLHQPSVVTMSHILVCDQNVWIPSSLTIPHSLLEPEADGQRVGLVCFAPSFKRVARFHDLDLKFEVVESIFQSDRVSMGDSEVGGALLTLWCREALEIATFDHKPITEANGGDFPGAGIHVVRQPGRKIKFVSNAFLKINGSDDETKFMSLFSAARRKRLIFTDLNSLFAPSSIMNINRLPSKLSNLVRVLRFVWDTIRLPVLVSAALRDPVGLGVVIAIFLFVQWIRLAVLVVAVIPKEVREEKPSLFTQVIYPVVFFFNDLLILRPLAMVAAVLWAVNDAPAQSIHEREDYERDLPPCLPYPDAPWFSAWRPLENRTDV